MSERTYGTLSDAQKAVKGGLSDRQKEVIYKMQKLVGFGKADKLGTYKEAAGGGDELKGTGNREKGNFIVVDTKEEADAAKEKNPNVKVRYNQPRDEDGQFASNAVNLRETKYPGRAKRESDAFRDTDIEKNINKEGVVKGTKGVSGDGVYKSGFEIESHQDLVDMSNDWKKFSERVLGANIVRQKGRRSKEALEMLKNGKEGFLRCDSKKINKWRDEPEYRDRIFKRKEDGKKPVKEPVKQETKINNNNNNGSISDEDVKTAKENPRQILDKYKDKINEIDALAKSKGHAGIKPSVLIKYIQNGHKSIFEDLKKRFESE